MALDHCNPFHPSHEIIRETVGPIGSVVPPRSGDTDMFVPERNTLKLMTCGTGVLLISTVTLYIIG